MSQIRSEFSRAQLHDAKDNEGIYPEGFNAAAPSGAFTVLPSWRRRGIALALLQHSFVELYQAGKRKVRLEVGTEKPTGATRLYEKAAMHAERRQKTFEKELRPGE